MATEETLTRSTSTTSEALTATEEPTQDVQAPKEGVSDAVKQAYLEDQKEKSK